MAETKKVATPKAAEKTSAVKTAPKAAAPAVKAAAPKAEVKAPVAKEVKAAAPKAAPKAEKKAYPQIKVTLIKSAAHVLEKQKRTIQALGLNRIGDSRTHNDIPAIQGMIFRVKHLVKVEKA